MEDGTPFGRYRLIELVGRGGMGEVWKAFDTQTERVVAVKVLPPSLANDPIFEQRFRREALAAASLNEPHIVPIHNFGEIDGKLYVDMRLIEGQDLQALLSGGPIDPERAVKIVEQIAAALHAAHRIGLVHRDVKPSNILVGEDDFAYLIDFGIARGADQTGLTSANSVIGTWAYLAPERLTTGQADARADTYALACVLHECLTGDRPFNANSLEQQVAAHLTLPPPRPSTTGNVPRSMDSVIATGMAKDPDQRYSSVKDFGKAAREALTDPHGSVNLQQYVQSAQSTQLAPPPPDRSATRWDNNPPSGPNQMPTQMRPAEQPWQQAYSQPQMHAAGPTRYEDQSRSQPTNYAAPYQYGQHGQPGQPAPPPAQGGGSKKMWIGIAAAAVVVALLAVLIPLTLLGGDDKPGGDPKQQNAQGDNGPINGVFDANLGESMSLHDAPYDEPPVTERWAFRSACEGERCVTTLSIIGNATFAYKFILDEIDGQWVGVATGTWTCTGEQAEVWAMISLKLESQESLDGQLTLISASPTACQSKRTISLKRTGDIGPSDNVADPRGIPARVVSPAAALRGRYHNVRVFPRSKQEYDYEALTACLRTGDKCVTYFHDAKSGVSLLFANDEWKQNETWDGPCPSGGTSHVTVTATFALPEPQQDPITLLSGKGRQEETGSNCVSNDFDARFERTGD